jgi:hypothetical protein
MAMKERIAQGVRDYVTIRGHQENRNHTWMDSDDTFYIRSARSNDDDDDEDEGFWAEPSAMVDFIVVQLGSELIRLIIDELVPGDLALVERTLRHAARENLEDAAALERLAKKCRDLMEED